MDQTSQDQDNSIHFLDYWRVIRTRKEIILAVTLLVTMVGVAVTTTMTKMYRATAGITVEQDSLDVAVFSSSNAASYNPYFLLTELNVIRSSLILGAVVDELKLQEAWAKKHGLEGGVVFPRKDTIDLLRNRIGVEQMRNSSIIEISAISDEPVEAADLANAIADLYGEYRLNSRASDVRRSIEKLTTELDRLSLEVEGAELEVERLRVELGVMEYQGMTMEVEKFRRLQADLVSYRVDMLTREARLREIEALEGDALVDVLLMNFPNRHLESIRDQLSDSEINLNMLLANLGAKHPDVLPYKSAVKELKEKLATSVMGIKAGMRTDYKVSKEKHDALERELVKYETAARDASSVKMLPFNRAQRELRKKRAIHAALQTRIEKELIEVKSPRNPVRKIDPAVAVDQDDFFRPRYLFNFGISVFVGLVFGIGLAYFIEYLDTSVKTVDDIERYLNTSVIGVIPQKVKALNQEGPQSPHAEAYRVLRTNLQFKNKGLGGGAFALCSGGVGEGKSTTLFNLAYVCAMMGDKVLIVDSDMRRPVQHTILGMSNRFGLTNVLMRDVPVDEAIKTTSHDNLHFLPSGRLSKGMLGVLDPQRLRELIKELKARYDYVFFDSPPIMGVSDSSIIASEVDGVLMVVQYRKYPRVISARAKKLIESVGGTVVGVVMNNINVMRDDYYYYYHSYHSAYSDPNVNREDGTDEQSDVEQAKERF